MSDNTFKEACLFCAMGLKARDGFHALVCKDERTGEFVQTNFNKVKCQKDD